MTYNIAKDPSHSIQRMKTYVHIKMCMWMCIVALIHNIQKAVNA